MKRCLFLEIYRWLGKIQWNIITWTRRFLQSLKYGRYYWCRLCVRKSLQRLWQKKLGEYHDLHVQSNTLLLANVFEHFRNMCLKIYEPDPIKIFSAPWLTWQAGVKKTKVKLDLLADINVLLMVEKGIRGRTTHSIY